MHLEQFQMADYEEVYALWIGAGIGVGSSDSRPQIQRVQERNAEFFLVAREVSEGRRIIGVIMGAHDGRRGYIHHLAVAPDRQKRGYGRALLEEVCARLARHGIEKVHLFVENSNREVIAFYHRLGWETRTDLTMLSLVVDRGHYIKYLNKR